MRITGGLARGVPLKCPRKNTRPATDAMREALFSSLAERVHDASVLDLFAGTGAYGLEALSRGARHATFVEQSPEAIKCLTQNLQALGKSAQRNLAKIAQIQRGDALKWLQQPHITFDLIIADPPYDFLQTFCEQGVHALSKHLQAPHGMLILEAPANVPAPEFPQLELYKRLGKKKSQSPTLLLYSLKEATHTPAT